MTQVNIHEAKTQLSKLIARAMDGEEVIIARANEPVVKLVPVEPTETKPTRRKLGGLEGVWPVPEDVKSSFQEEIDKLFHTSDRPFGE